MPAEPGGNETFPVLLNGFTDLPPGKVATTVTYLQQLEKPEPKPDPPSVEGLALERLKGAHVERYLNLFEAVGEEFLWASRRKMPREQLIERLDENFRHLFALTKDGKDMGLLELNFVDLESRGDVEIVFFGVVKEAIGTGTSRWLMNRALEQSWGASGTKRVYLLTCSFDHPGAIRFYKKSGFVPYKLAIEVKDDPRLIGVLPKTAAPHVVLIE